ncbi:MAG: hypothetical protein ACR2NZ_17310 [Rubripirellula sp.]
METVERDYAPKGVKFLYIYKALAHPETNGYVAPFNLKERLMHVAEAKRTLGSQIPWICDSMTNELKHALGNRPNSEFIIGPDGIIVSARDWSDPSALREDLAELVGPVENPTTIADLDMPTRAPPERAATGIVKRIVLPGQMSPFKIDAVESKTPHYAKLRVESGDGKLYLGFFLDPLYKVHWNNKAPTLTYSIETPEGVTIAPVEGKGPKVDVDADADPREFLLDVQGKSSEPLKIVVKYFACDDAETFCIPVTQEYLVTMERDPDGGNRRSAGGRRPGGGGRSSGARPQGQGRPGIGNNPWSPRGSGGNGSRMQDMMRRIPVFAALDQNGDGVISAEEMEQAPASLEAVDRDKNGEISASELLPQSSSRTQRRPPSR